MAARTACNVWSDSCIRRTVVLREQGEESGDGSDRTDRNPTKEDRRNDKLENNNEGQSLYDVTQTIFIMHSKRPLRILSSSAYL